MANLILQLDEQLADVRSREKTYRFTAENRGSKTVSLRPLAPQIPEGVALLDVKDSSERAVLLKRSMLCTELTAILNSYLRRLDGDLNPRRTVLDRLRSTSDAPGPRPAPRVVRDWTSSTDTTEKTLGFDIQGRSDAEVALTTWFKDADGTPEKDLFTAKLAQLKRYDEHIDKAGGAEKAARATLAPGSAFSTTYVFRFKRGHADTQRYTITIEAAYVEEGSEIEDTGAVSQSAIISPSPIILSVVAVLSSVLGAVLKAAVATPSPVAASPAAVGVLGALRQLGEQLAPAVISLQMLGAMVIALLMFNVYEHTDLGARLKIGVAWRSALLIGVLSGAFTERLLEALKVLAGVK